METSVARRKPADRGKEELLDIVTKLLGAGHDLRFLLALDEVCLEQLIVAIRVRLEKRP